MAAPRHFSIKRLQIEKANSTIVAAVALAAFVVVFVAISSQALIKRIQFQSNVIAAKEKTRDQLIKNKEHLVPLANSYKAFADQDVNIIGGKKDGKTDRDGDNPKIVLDALPSKYDFPALATSLEKILLDRSIAIESIGGTDDELLQSQQAANNGSVAPIEVPFTVDVKGNYLTAQQFFAVLESSIRPIRVSKIQINATDNSDELKITINANTYYQPRKAFSVGTKELTAK